MHTQRAMCSYSVIILFLFLFLNSINLTRNPGERLRLCYSSGVTCFHCQNILVVIWSLYIIAVVCSFCNAPTKQFIEHSNCFKCAEGYVWCNESTYLHLKWFLQPCLVTVTGVLWRHVDTFRLNYKMMISTLVPLFSEKTSLDWRLV